MVPLLLFYRAELCTFNFKLVFLLRFIAWNLFHFNGRLSALRLLSIAVIRHRSVLYVTKCLTSKSAIIILCIEPKMQLILCLLMMVAQERNAENVIKRQYRSNVPFAWCSFKSSQPEMIATTRKVTNLYWESKRKVLALLLYFVAHKAKQLHLRQIGFWKSAAHQATSGKNSNIMAISASPNPVKFRKKFFSVIAS